MTFGCHRKHLQPLILKQLSCPMHSNFPLASSPTSSVSIQHTTTESIIPLLPSFLLFKPPSTVYPFHLLNINTCHLHTRHIFPIDWWRFRCPLLPPAAFRSLPVHVMIFRICGIKFKMSILIILKTEKSSIIIFTTQSLLSGER